MSKMTITATIGKIYTSQENNSFYLLGAIVNLQVVTVSVANAAS